jgi:hypothetical protein
MAYKYPEINKIFDDLDTYREFCKDFGHIFNEAHLYDARTPWGQYERYKRGQRVINNWKEDRRAFNTAKRH